MGLLKKLAIGFGILVAIIIIGGLATLAAIFAPDPRVASLEDRVEDAPFTAQEEYKHLSAIEACETAEAMTHMQATERMAEEVFDRCMAQITPDIERAIANCEENPAKYSYCE